MSAMSPSDGYSAPAVPYATPMPRPAAKVWAGAAILFGGLCLILLGGCFLIGVMGLVQPSAVTGFASPPPALTTPQTALMLVLYLLAALSFAGAVLLLFVGTRALLRVMRA